MEKSLKIDFNYSSGPADPHRASVGQVNEDTTKEEADNKGTIAFLVETSSPTKEKEQLQEKAKEVAASFEEKYLTSSAGTILKSLEEALESTKSFSETNLDLEIVACVVWGLVLYVGKLGEGGIFLSRGGSSKKINFSYVASGMIQDGDRLFLANSVFLGKCSLDDFNQAVSTTETTSLKREVDELQKETVGSECVVLQIKLKEVPAEEVPITFVNTDQPKQNRNLSLQTLKEKAGFVRVSGVQKFRSQSLPALGRVGGLLASLKNKLQDPWRARQPGELVDLKAHKKARAFQVGILLAALLLISVSASIMKVNQNAKRKTAETTISQIDQKLAQAKELVGNDPQGAASLLTEAANLIDDAKKKNLGDRLGKEEAELAALRQENEKIFPVQGLSEVADLASLSAKADDLVETGGALFSLDKAAGRLIRIDLKSQKPVVLAEGLEKPVALAVGEAGVYLAGQSKVWLFPTKGGSGQEVLSSSAWGTIIGVSTYKGNLYLLDSKKDQVWKFVGNGTSFTSAQVYFGSSAGLSKALSIAIDGYVWISFSDGRVSKYLSGKRQDFELSGATFATVGKIFTETGTTNLYLLSPTESKVVIFDKSGSYLKSYKDKELAQAKSFFVDEKAKTVWFSEETKIYQFKMQ